MLTTQRRLRSNNVLAVPARPRQAWPRYDRDRQAYRGAIAELLELDRRDPARRRRVDEKFGAWARFARRFPSLQDAVDAIAGATISLHQDGACLALDRSKGES